MNNESLQTLKRRDAEELLGVKTSTFYEHQRNGVLPPPVKLFGGNASGWLVSELKAAKAAMIAGESKESIQALIKSLVNKRKELAPTV